jgi:hypothetical protein
MRFPPEKLYFSYKMTIKKAFRAVKEKDQQRPGGESESAVATRKNVKKRKPQLGAWMTGGSAQAARREGAFCAMLLVKDLEACLGHL